MKYAHDSDMDALCRKALEQIKRERYAERLYEEGMHTVLKYGIACYKRECKVVLEAL